MRSRGKSCALHRERRRLYMRRWRARKAHPAEPDDETRITGSQVLDTWLRQKFPHLKWD